MPHRSRVVLLSVAALALAGGASAPGAGAYVYWANNPAGAVGRSNRDGSGVVQRFITGGNLLQGVAVDGAHIYWANQQGVAGAIGRAGLDGGTVNQAFLGGDFTQNPKGVAVGGGFIYWANSYGSISRAGAEPGPAGGKLSDWEIVKGLTNVEGVAVDDAHLYWANHMSIGRANLDGSGADPQFITGANQPREVAVDGGYIYWSNYGAPSESGSIGRAKLDGTAVNQNFIGGLDAAGAPVTTHPSGVAVGGGRIYWSNETTGWIGSANVDGTGAKRNVIAADYGVTGVAVDGLGPAAGPAPAAGAALALSLGGASRQVVRDRRSITMTITCGVACTAAVTAQLTVDGRVLTTWSGTSAVAAQKGHGVRFSLSPRNLSRLRTALRARRRVRFTVKVSATSSDSRVTSTRTRTWTVTLPAERDGTTVRAERALAQLVAATYGDAGPVVSCTALVARTRWSCSFTAYTGGGQRCDGAGAGAVRRTGGRYRASINRTRVTCREQ